MSQEKDKKIEKWIDLSALPKRKDGRIDWINSTGHHAKFMYNGVLGELIILEYYKNKRSVRIFIENYTTLIGHSIETVELLRGNLGGVIRKNILVNATNLMQYLIDNNDALCTIGSNKIIKVKCPICGYQKEMRVSDLVNGGFSCNRCGDGISYANKFMMCLLKQLNCNFIPEISKKISGFEWMENFRYDFLLFKNNKKYLIEMDGSFHTRQTNIKNITSLKQRRVVDEYKNNIAKSHGLSVIRIDCDYCNIQNRYNLIKNNVLQSELNNILDLDNCIIDWNQCDMTGHSNLCVIACNYWNNGVRNVSQISKIMHINSETVRRYLKTCTSIGMCNYDPQAAFFNAFVEKRRPIAVYNDDNSIFYTFRDYETLIDASQKLFGKQFHKSSIYGCCEGYYDYAYGYNMRYLTLQEYEQFQTMQN